MKGKSGMIRIIEAFSMILLITGVVLVILNQGYIQKGESYSEIYKIEQEMLREIQLNNTAREEIVSSSSLPVEWENFPSATKSEITSNIPGNLNCEGKICSLNDDCVLGKSLNSSVYTQRVLISSGASQYNPRKVKIFCWAK